MSGDPHAKNPLDRLVEAHPGIHPGGESTDSAGIPFGGREVTSTGFDNDTGEADAELMRLLEAGDEEAWVSRLAQTRLLVPIVAAPTEVTTDENTGLTAEKSTDMAVVTITAPDGTKGLPVFTSMQELGEWDPSARPSPVRAPFAAQAAISEECQVLLLDMASKHRVVVRPSMVWALAQGQSWVPAHKDEHVRQAVAHASRGIDGLSEVHLGDGGDGVLKLELLLTPGLSQEQVQGIATRIGEELATDGEVRARIEGLAFSVLPAK